MMASVGEGVEGEQLNEGEEESGPSTPAPTQVPSFIQSDFGSP